MLIINGRPVLYPVSEKLHDYFRLLTAACEDEQRFGNALRELFENVDLFTRSAGIRALNVAEGQPLSPEERARLLTIATSMRQLIASDTASAEIKAAAYLIVALTKGNDFPRDTVDTQELMRLPILYPDQRLTGFLSQYYLSWALTRRGKQAEAVRIDKQATKKYSDCVPLLDLEAYREVRNKVSQADRTHQSPGP